MHGRNDIRTGDASSRTPRRRLRSLLATTSRPNPQVVVGSISKRGVVVRRVIRLKEVIAQTGLSRSTIFAPQKQGTFPQSIKIGPKASGWYEVAGRASGGRLSMQRFRVTFRARPRRGPRSCAAGHPRCPERPPGGRDVRTGGQPAGLESFGALMTISRSSRMSARRSWMSACTSARRSSDVGLHVCPEVSDVGLHVCPEVSDVGLHVCPEVPDGGPHVVDAGIHVGVLLKHQSDQHQQQGGEPDPGADDRLRVARTCS